MTSAAKSIGKYVKGVIDEIKETIAGTGKTVKGLVVFIVTTLLNQLGNKEFFKCPPKNYVCAGWSFIIIPGVLLGMLVLMGTNSVSNGSILCCKDASVKRKRKRFCFFMKAIALALGYSLLAFLSWVVASFLFTETYACIKLGPMPNTKNATILAVYKTNKETKNAVSMIIGLWTLVIALCILMGFFFWNKCFLTKLSEITDRLKGEECYDECEAKAAKKAFDKLVEVSGKYNAEKFVDELVPVEYAKKEPPPKNKQEQDQGTEPKDSKPKEDSKPKKAEAKDDSEGETDYEAVALPKAELMELRKALIKKYPRLDNPLDWDLEYVEKACCERVDTDDKPEGAGESHALIAREGTNSGDC